MLNQRLEEAGALSQKDQEEVLRLKAEFKALQDKYFQSSGHLLEETIRL